jgi:hypothetical protein
LHPIILGASEIWGNQVTVTLGLFLDAPLSSGLFHVAESYDHAAKLADFVDHESKCPSGSVRCTPGVRCTWMGYHLQVQRTPGVHRTIATMVDTMATTCNMK